MDRATKDSSGMTVFLTRKGHPDITAKLTSGITLSPCHLVKSLFNRRVNHRKALALQLFAVGDFDKGFHRVVAAGDVAGFV